MRRAGSGVKIYQTTQANDETFRYNLADWTVFLILCDCTAGVVWVHGPVLDV